MNLARPAARASLSVGRPDKHGAVLGPGESSPGSNCVCDYHSVYPGRRYGGSGRPICGARYQLGRKFPTPPLLLPALRLVLTASIGVHTATRDS